MAFPISVGSGATLASNLLNGEHLQVISPVSLYPLPAGGNFIGLATVVAGAAIPVTDNSGSLTVDFNSGATVAVSHLPSVTVGAALPTGGNFIGLATVVAGAALPVTDNGGSLTVDFNSGATVAVSHLPNVTVGAALPAGGNFIGIVSTASIHGKFDVVAALPAGNNNIGDVDIASIAAGDNNIGNVDVASSALPTGASTSANQSTIIGHLDGVEGLLTTIDSDTGTVAGAVSGTEMQVDVVASLPAGTNAIGKLAANSGVDIGDVDVTSISAGTNNIGNVGIIPRTSGGMTIFRSIDLDESEEEVKATPGQVFSITAFNTTAAPLYLKFYNATAANVTVGTTAPVLTFVVPGNADSDGAGFIWNNEMGLAFGTAITVAATTGVADNDTGAPGANACIVNIGYA